MHAPDFVLDRPQLLRRRPEDAVLQVFAHVRRVRRDHRDFELVELAQLFGDCDRRTGHARDLGVAREQRLHGDRVEDLAAVGGGDLFLRLDGRLQAVRPALKFGDAPAGRVDQLHLAVADKIVDVAGEQRVRVQADVSHALRPSESVS